MAGRHKQPVDVIVARGKSHLTRVEKERRKAEEATVPPHLRAVQAPEYLSEWPDLVDAFYRYAEMLRDIMPEQFGQPDADLLARYLVSERLFESLTSKLVKLDDVDGIKSLQVAQDKAFKQAHTSASALGLTVTSRCRLVVPSGGEDDDESEF